MTYRNLGFEITSGVAWVTIARPAAMNALDLDAMRELYEVANRCGSDKSVRCVVITGAGEKAFSAGGDVAGFAANADRVDMLIKEMTTYFHMAISRFAWMDAPVIAMVNGVAAGAGLSLMAACDLAICHPGAKFTSAYTRIGLTPDGSSSYFLTRLIGTRRTAELYLTNRVLTAEEALAWGLVNRVVPQDALRAETAKLAEELAAGPTRAHGGAKRLLLMSTQDSLESQMERETRQIVELAVGEDGREGVKAFIERRPAKFAGR